jgi:N-acetylglucosaminylphosphatidylinositol deacetylase
MSLGKAVTQTSLKDTVQVLQLRSPSLYWKYTGPIYALIDRFVSHTQEWIQVPSLKSSAATLVSSPRDWWIGFKAMLEHRTQLVWFRWLYLAFSQLMWINQFDIAT